MKTDLLNISEALHLGAVGAETVIDRVRKKISETLGTDVPRQIAAYHGFADATSVHVSGRVLGNRPNGGPLDKDGWWQNLVNTYQRWESDELSGVPVTVTFQNFQQTVWTDEEGYYAASFPIQMDRSQLQWLTAHASAGEGFDAVQSTHQIMVPPIEGGVGIISDLDDTVIHTGITNLVQAAKLTFLENAKTRKPLDGVAKLYELLQKGNHDRPTNPIFYISSSPWNLHDLLIDFMRMNEVPAGPLFLRDLGLDRQKFIKESGHSQKGEKALKLLDSFPNLPFVLIGDSGQQDPLIYAEVCSARPGRVLAIYIRDVDPGRGSPLDAEVRKSIEIAALAGVPMVLVEDSRGITLHAMSIGLIPAPALREVSKEIAADQSRPEVGEQALKDALDSVLPQADLDETTAK